MPEWTAQHAAQWPLSPPGAGEIRFALLVLTVAAFAVTYRSVRKGPKSVWAYLLFGCVVTMLANVVIPHVPASVVYRSYTPGVVTAVLINLPVMGVLAMRAVREHWVEGWRAAAFAVAVPLAILSSIATLLVVGRAIL